MLALLAALLAKAAAGLATEGACHGFDEMWGLCPHLPKCDQCMPVDCQFSDWGEWHDPYGGCTGLRFHQRTVALANNECGKPCTGPKIESVEHVPEECLLEARDCLLADWSAWSECKGVTGQVYRRRQVLATPLNGGMPCTGSAEETLPCGQGPTPVACEFSPWQEWTGCSSTCGYGRHTRMRRVLSEAQHSGDTCKGMTLETKSCLVQECGGHDCVMGDWADWSMCDVERHPQRFRRRQVKEGATGTGMRCNETLKETSGCPEPLAEPCRLSEWAEWQALGRQQPGSACSRQCGGGQAFRTRTMQAPPSHGGDCPDSSLTQLKACNTQPCNAVCELSDWSQWSGCSAKCGKGTTTRGRALLTQSEKFSEGCQGPLVEALPCIGQDGQCPNHDCRWSEWHAWSACSASCGGGLRRRSRAVVAQPEHGGKACDALVKSEAAPCNAHPCGEGCVDGRWADWQEWEACSSSCGSAYTARRRSVAEQPNSCGAPVTGVRAEYLPCEGLPACAADADCQLADWSDWSFCYSKCFGVRERNRYIRVFATGHGKPCRNESLKELSPCNPGPGEAPSGDCALPQPADCQLSLWSDWSACTRSCGGGQRLRKRRILQLPKSGGLPCDSDMEITNPCNSGPCEVEKCTDCRWGAWADWGDCSKCGGERYRHRSIEQMPNYCGRMCDLQSAKEVSNCTGHCKETLFCTWTEWSAPSGCGTGCGTGTMLRTRALSLKASAADFLFAGSDSVRCHGAQMNVSDCPNMQPCTAPCVPRDCVFAQWGAWSPPTGTGLCERRRNIAVTNNECGVACQGPLGETRRCLVPNPDREDCALSDWTAWSGCHMSGRVGQRFRERSIVQQPTFDGTPCSTTLNETQRCSQFAAVDCKLSQWADWSACQKSCGGGIQQRKRLVLAKAEHGGALCEDSLEELRMCNTELCFHSQQDCLYSDWAMWSGCGAHGQRYRERKITNYASGGGRLCHGDLEEIVSCAEDERVDCVVSDWTMWDACDKQCGGGQTARQRQIMVFPVNGGEPCPGDLIQTVGCNREQCSVQDCQVTDWQEWSSCSASCNQGQRWRQRKVLHTRSPGGAGCSLELTQLTACMQAPCPRDDCQWGLWEAWSACSASCDGGQQTRLRHIARMPTHGGKLCKVQDKEEVQPCSTQPCFVPTCEDGAWSDWEGWSPCSKSCGGGTTFRKRQVARMANECGAPVAGPSRETQFCAAEVPCEPTLDCLFTDWGAWSACSQTCNGLAHRSRRIHQYGSGAGAFCAGSLKESSPCNPGVQELTPLACADDPPVDCALADWSDWGTCSASCGGGQEIRARELAQSPANGGKACDGPLTVLRQCGAAACPGPEPVDCAYGEWVEWGACDKCGGERTRFRHITEHARHGGKSCEPFEAEEVGACPRQCHEKKYCTWGDWGSWGECTARCGEGKRARRRHLNLTLVPSEPPAPAEELVGAYAELRRQAEGLEARRGTELATAFACGFCSFVAALAGLRAVLASRSARGRSPGTVSVGARDTIRGQLMPTYHHLEEAGA